MEIAARAAGKPLTPPPKRTQGEHRKSHNSSAFAIQQRAEALFQAHHRGSIARTDHWFALLMIGQWVATVLTAQLLAPASATYNVAGGGPSPIPAVTTAAILGALISALPVTLGLLRPGERETRFVIAVGQMLMSGLMIYVTGGRIETHFHIFGSLAFLAFYLDWRVLTLASLVVTLDQAIRGLYFPQSVFGTTTVDPYRWIEHLGWIAFTDTFLIVTSLHRLTEMRQTAERQARVEGQNVTMMTRARALSASEERFRQLAESLGLVLWIVDRRSGCILYVNAVYEMVWDRTRQSLYDNPHYLFEAVHLDDRDRLREVLMRDSAGEPRSEEIRVLRRDGSRRWVLVRGFPIEDGDGVVYRVAGVAEDITERKAEETRREQAFERERRIAAVLQESLLMHPSPDRLPGVELALFHHAARPDEAAVSGDFFDAFPIDDRRSAFAVGDISGKGLKAAARTAEVKYALRAYLRDGGRLDEAMTRLNRFLYNSLVQEGEFGTFVALSVVVFDRAAGTATIAQAGAEPVMVVDTSGTPPVVTAYPNLESSDVLDTFGGLPLGIDVDAPYDSRTIPLAAADLMLLCSDGLSESRGVHRPLLGTAGVARLLVDAVSTLPPDASPGDVGEHVLSAVRDYTGGRFLDDVCVLLFHPTQPSAGR